VGGKHQLATGGKKRKRKKRAPKGRQGKSCPEGLGANPPRTTALADRRKGRPRKIIARKKKGKEKKKGEGDKNTLVQGGEA